MAKEDSLTCKTRPLIRMVHCDDCGHDIPKGQKVRFVSGSIDDKYFSRNFHYACYPESGKVRGVTVVNKD